MSSSSTLDVPEALDALEAPLLARASGGLFRFATAGSVDDGKSTLVGRLLHDAKAILADQLESVARTSVERGFAAGTGFDFALLTDGLRAEREQGITIDVAYRYFTTGARSFILADCPGHVQYTRNMVTGSATADAVIMLIDARAGVLEQTRRHLSVVHLLRVPHVIIAVNKIDLLDYDQAAFESVERDVLAATASLGIEGVHVIPISALEGDNIVEVSERTPWYTGPSLLHLLESLPSIDELNIGDRVEHGSSDDDLRFAVQLVIRPQGGLAPGLDENEFRDYRGFAGQISSGSVRVGDRVTVHPSGVQTSVIGIDTADGALDEARAPLSVTLRLADAVDAARGSLITLADHGPALTREVTADLFWLDARPVHAGDRVLVKHGTSTVAALVTAVTSRRNLDTFENEPADTLVVNDIGRAELKLAAALPIDTFSAHRRTGAFLVIDPNDGATLAAAIVPD
ncbi:MAG TPA: GTP-binding protein [Pseudolysinimonas sp.]|nr:GTP-binding protein [Pseudolysinimonas sp.]